jgi:hypothetical protein
MYFRISRLRVSPLVALLAALAAFGTLSPTDASAMCDVIPSSVTTYPSTLGEASTPFAAPGEIVTISRDVAVFSETLGLNSVEIRFTPEGGPQTIGSRTCEQARLPPNEALNQKWNSVVQRVAVPFWHQPFQARPNPAALFHAG